MANSKILLVEDDKVQSRATKESLECIGYEVLTAVDGKSAIKIAKTQRIDIILLDRILPDLDGNEVCRWLKLDKETMNIPVIMLTVKSSTMEKVEGLKAGADDYLPKPYSEIELNARIYSALRTKALQDELRKKNLELQEILSKLETLAITDPLTELFNRRYFETVCEKEFSRTLRYKSPTSCLVIDVDFFKRVNDEYGHRAGDFVLKELAAIIRNCMRKVDTVARWGGEEFVLLLPGTGRESAVLAAGRILSAIAGHTFSGIDSPITVSIGVASVPDSSIGTAEQFIDKADMALYEAKSKGRNRIEVAT